MRFKKCLWKRKIKNNNNSIKVKLTSTFSASRAALPTFVTVSSLSKNELKMTDEDMQKHKGICIMKIKGLSIYSVVDPLCNQIGCIVLCWLSKNESHSCKEARMECCRGKVLRPHVNNVRKLKFANWEENDPIQPEMIAVSWCNGTIDQRNSVIQEESILKDEKCQIVSNKHN